LKGHGFSRAETSPLFLFVRAGLSPRGNTKLGGFFGTTKVVP